MPHHGTLPLWLADALPPRRPVLDEDRDVDVAVIGAGIAGVTTALLLQRDGARVALLDRGPVAGGATGYTTAKVSALQQTRYRQIRDVQGTDAATAYAQASLGALDRIAAFVEEGIACGWERTAAFTYAADAEQADAVRDEADAAREAGLAVDLVEDVPLPFAAAVAVHLGGQAQFDPVRYVQGLADLFTAAGGEIFEHSPVTDVHEGTPCRVETQSGFTVRARDVVVCTNYPLLDRGLYFARTASTRSYLVAAQVAAGAPPLPPGMFISAGTPTRSLRSYRDPEGRSWLLVGGEGHATGADAAQPERYDRLEAFARAHFDVGEIPYRWSTQDAMPADELPYVGRYTPVSRHLFINAGGQKWGMTNGTAGAMILADRLAGRRHPQDGAFEPARLSLRSVPSLAKEQATVGAHFVGDRLRGTDAGGVDDVPRGEARTLRDGHGRTGVYRDADGGLHAVSVRCTHLGCLLRFNDAEHSWDCPCHGSRFDVDGGVLAGPATAPLEQKDLPG